MSLINPTIFISQNSKNINPNSYFKITFGNFYNYGGSSDISIKKFQDLIKFVSKSLSNKYTSESSTIYEIYNKRMIVKNNSKFTTQFLSLDCFINNHYIIELINETKILNNEFPILNKYKMIVKRNIKKYYINDNIIINFIEDTANDSVIRNIIIDFNKRYDDIHIFYIIDQISQILFNT